jgi:NADH-quinone oxidoreductase subunit H
MIGGWASNNKFSLLGAIRASAQMISYEVAMGLSIIALVMMTGTLSLKEICEYQAGGVGGNWTFWNVVYQPLSFMIFIICAFAECNRAPFDLPECETELVGGYHTEFSSMKLGLYLFAEYINMFISSAIMATLFFGGYNFPFMHDLGLSQNAITLIGTAVLFGKITFFIFFFMWIRWTIPRFRYDQLMNLGWKGLLPLAIANVLITGLFILLNNKG